MGKQIGNTIRNTYRKLVSVYRLSIFCFMFCFVLFFFALQLSLKPTTLAGDASDIYD